MTKKKKSEERVFASSANNCEQILFSIYRQLFSTLLEKSLRFYKWFHTQHQPTCIYDSRDVACVLHQLESDKPTDIGSLTGRISGFCISDAIVVMDAIQWRMFHLREETDTKQISRNDAVELIFDCLRCYAEQV